MVERDRHLDDGRLLTHLDGELGREDDRRVAEHLEACEPCRARARRLREMAELAREKLPAIDVEPPTPDPARVRAVAEGRRGGSADAAAGQAPAERRSLRRGLLQAAAVVLCVATAAAAVVPGSPLRDWITDAAGPLVSGPEPEPPAPTRSRPARETVAIPVTDRAVVELGDPEPGLVVRVVMTERRRLAVTARAASFVTGPGSVTVSGPTGDDVLVELPRSVPAARISSDRRLLLEKDQGRIWVHASADTTPTGYLLRPGAGREDLLR